MSPVHHLGKKADEQKSLTRSFNREPMFTLVFRSKLRTKMI
jgi:hypothetical protein